MPDAIVSYQSPNQNIALFPALRAAGYTGPLVDFISYGPDLLEDTTANAAFQDAYFAVPVQPRESDTPEVREMLGWLQQATGEEDVDYTVDMGVGYASAQAFLAVLEEAGEDLTPESFQEAASDLDVTGSVGGPLSLPEARTSTPGCYALVQLVGTEFTVVSELTCEPVVQFTE